MGSRNKILGRVAPPISQLSGSFSAYFLHFLNLKVSHVRKNKRPYKET
jgi:hypothetical protein